MSSAVALVSREPHVALLRYLGNSGFDARAFPNASAAPHEGTLVWLPSLAVAESAIVDTVRIWLGTRADLWAIVVSERAARLHKAAADMHARWQVLPAPIFGWQLVDALRAKGLGLS